MKITHTPHHLFLISSVVCAAASLSAYADDYYYDGYYYHGDGSIDWQYTVENGCATIASASLHRDYVDESSPSWNGAIPSSFDYYDSTLGSSTSFPVTAIGDYAFSSLLSDLSNNEYDSYISISLPDTVRRIGDEAFACYTFVNSTVYPYFDSLPPDIEYIGSSAFDGCDFYYYSYDYVGGVVVFDGWAVRDDERDFSGTLEQYNTPRIIDLSSAKGIAASLFSHGRPMKVTLPSALKIVPHHAFYWSDLKEIVIPATVTNIEYCAFTKCTSLTNITFAGNAPVVADPWGMWGNPIRGVFDDVNSNCVVTVQRGSTGWGEVPGTWQGMAIRYADEEPTPATFTITWKDDDGTTLATETLAEGTTPSRPGPTKPADAPYVYTFAGWTPTIAAVSSNASYTATYTRAADLSTLTGNWTASDADVLTNSTTHVITIPAGAMVTINGVTVAGGAGSGATGPAVFADGGEAITTSIAPGANGKWMLTAFAELASGSADGLDDAQVKVYAADTLADLASAQPMASGVVVTNKAPAVKVELEVTPPANADAQFFRVGFGE